jgi:hypothetical protein
MRLIWVCVATPLNFLSLSMDTCIDLLLGRMEDFLSSAPHSKLKLYPQTLWKRFHSFADASQTMKTTMRTQTHGHSKLLTSPRYRPLSKTEAIGASRWISARVPRVAARCSLEAHLISSPSRVHTHFTPRVRSMERARRVWHVVLACKIRTQCRFIATCVSSSTA